MRKKGNIMEIDVHGYELWEAIDEILYILEECRINGDRELVIIHGYQRGQVLKSFFQSKKFLEEMARKGFHLRRKETFNPGISCFELI